MVSPTPRRRWPRRGRPMAPQSYSGSLENGGADMLLMTGNTRSGGGSQGRAYLARSSQRSGDP